MTTNVLEIMRIRAFKNPKLERQYRIEKLRFKMDNKVKDLKNVARRESYFSTLAKKEAKGASKRAKSEAKKGMKESAKDSRFERMIDEKFAEKRKKLAEKAKSKIKK